MVHFKNHFIFTKISIKNYIKNVLFTLLNLFITFEYRNNLKLNPDSHEFLRTHYSRNLTENMEIPNFNKFS